MSSSAKTLKLEFQLQAATITRENGPLISIYPPDSPVPPGVGRSIAGSYVSPPGSEVEVKQTYIQTATAAGIAILGQMHFDISTPCHKISLFYAYETVNHDPSMIFAVGPIKGQVTAALLDGRSAKARLRLVSPDGGRTGSGFLTIKTC